ncbi:hypothetical protein GC177_07980 [bacterium]|nr:hypothetical protein [bacterium]
MLTDRQIWEHMAEAMGLVVESIERNNAMVVTFACGDAPEVIDRFLWLVGMWEDASLGKPPVIEGLNLCPWDNMIEFSRDELLEKMHAHYASIDMPEPNDTWPEQVQLTTTRDAAIALKAYIHEQLDPGLSPS